MLDHLASPAAQLNRRVHSHPFGLYLHPGPLQKMLNTGGGWKRGEGPVYEGSTKTRDSVSIGNVVHLQSIQLYLRSTRGLICDSDKSIRSLSSACSVSLSAPSPSRMLVESMSIGDWDDDVLLPVKPFVLLPFSYLFSDNIGPITDKTICSLALSVCPRRGET